MDAKSIWIDLYDTRTKLNTYWLNLSQKVHWGNLQNELIFATFTVHMG